MKRPRMLVPACLILTALALPGQAIAQDASPPAGAAQSAGVQCATEPRDVDELVALWFDEAGNPAATPTMNVQAVDVSSLPQGEPADEATLTEIDQTTREWIACFVLGAQYARGFNLMTTELAAMFGPDIASPNEDTPDEVRALLEAQLAGTPIPGDEMTGVTPEIEGPTDARMLPDGRVGAIWSLDGDRLFIFYEQQDGRWLLDDFLDIQDTGVTPTS